LIKEMFADFKLHMAPRADGSQPPKPKWNQEIWTKVSKNGMKFKFEYFVQV